MVRVQLACSGRGENGLSEYKGSASLNGAVLFDRIDLRVGAQIVQVFLGELSGVTVDDFELVNNVAWGGRDVGLGGRDVGLGGADMGSERYIVLEGNDIPARDRFLGFGNSKKGGHWERVR